MLKASKTIELYVSEDGVKPRSMSLIIRTAKPKLFKLLPDDVIMVEMKGFEKCRFQSFYPRKPDWISKGETVNLSWVYTKPKVPGSPSFLWGVSFRVEAEGLSPVGDLNLLEWNLAPKEASGAASVALRLRYRLDTPSPSTAIVGPIPLWKPGASFRFERGLRGCRVDRTPSRVYGEVQTLVLHSRSVEGSVCLDAVIRVEAWSREELLVSGRVEVEKADYPVRAYLKRSNQEVVELPGKALLIYGLPDLKIVCSPPGG